MTVTMREATWSLVASTAGAVLLLLGVLAAFAPSLAAVSLPAPLLALAGVVFGHVARAGARAAGDPLATRRASIGMALGYGILAYCALELAVVGIASALLSR